MAVDTCYPILIIPEKISETVDFINESSYGEATKRYLTSVK